MAVGRGGLEARLPASHPATEQCRHWGLIGIGGGGEGGRRGKVRGR